MLNINYYNKQKRIRNAFENFNVIIYRQKLRLIRFQKIKALMGFSQQQWQYPAFIMANLSLFIYQPQLMAT